MVEKPQPTDESTVAPAGQATTAPGPRRGPGHRGADMRDTVAEMAERAQLISQEAGSKIAGAMKDVIAAAAGLAGFAIESARDLVQYMVRRGQMTQEEADRIIRDAEEAHGRRSPEERSRPTASKVAAEAAAVAAAARAAAAAAAAAANPPAPFPPPRMAPLTTGRAASNNFGASRPAPNPPPAVAAKPAGPAASAPAAAPRRASAPASKGAVKRATGKGATKAAARPARPGAKSSPKAARPAAKKSSKRR
jgi:hypothetical protein